MKYQNTGDAIIIKNRFGSKFIVNGHSVNKIPESFEGSNDMLIAVAIGRLVRVEDKVPVQKPAPKRAKKETQEVKKEEVMEDAVD